VKPKKQRKTIVIKTKRMKQQKKNLKRKNQAYKFWRLCEFFVWMFCFISNET